MGEGVGCSKRPLGVASISNDKVETGEPGARCEMSFILRCHLIPGLPAACKQVGAAPLRTPKSSALGPRLQWRSVHVRPCVFKPIKAAECVRRQVYL